MSTVSTPLWRDWRTEPNWTPTPPHEMGLLLAAEKIAPKRTPQGFERSVIPDVAKRGPAWVNPHDDLAYYARRVKWPWGGSEPPKAGIFEATRRLGGRIVGGRGSGKTVYMAAQTFFDFMDGVGSIVIDPMGTLSHYLFARLAPWLGGRTSFTWDRVVYVPVGGMRVGGENSVVPTPFLFNTGQDSLYDQTQRVVDVWKRLNPEQESAPIQGMPSIERTANHLGMLLSAMGCQLVPDAAAMLREPERWLPRARELAARHPYELAEPLQTLELYADPRFPRRDERSETLSFLNKIAPSVLSPRLAAQYGANAWGVDLSAVDIGKLIIFDCSALQSRAEKKAMMAWLFQCCMEYFRFRGVRRDTVGFVIDELTFLVDEENRLLEDDFEDLFVRISRNYGVAPFVAYQALTQPTERMRTNLDMLGYSLLGPPINVESAELMAQMIDHYDPLWVKSEEEILGPMRIEERPDLDKWINEEVARKHDLIEYEVRDISHRTTYYTPPEQLEMNTTRCLKTKPGEFYYLETPEEGGTAHCQYRVTIKAYLERQPFDFSDVPAQQAALVQRDGRKVADVLAEIEARQPPPLPPTAPRTPRPRPQPPSPTLFDEPPQPPPPRRGPPPRTSRD